MSVTDGAWLAVCIVCAAVALVLFAGDLADWIDGLAMRRRDRRRRP